jgi:hypothetical protein
MLEASGSGARFWRSAGVERKSTLTHRAALQLCKDQFVTFAQSVGYSRS